ncbi:malate dehydrogenase [bacterium]|nr:malate dehydrogenase [bacterium]
MKIAIIGAGRVGASLAFALQMKGVGREIILLDVREELAKGEAEDLLQGTSTAYPQKFSSDRKDAREADVFVVTAGARREPNESRLSLIQRNLAIFREVLAEIKELKKENSILLVISNPVDVLTYFAHKESGFPKERIIGLGTLLDTLRLRAYLATTLRVDPRDVQAMVLGEHGDSMVFPFSIASIGGVPLSAYPGVDEVMLRGIGERVRKAGAEMIRLKGGAGTAVALAGLKVIESIERDSRSVMPLSVYLEGEMGFEDVCLSLPCVVGKNGIEDIIQPPLNEDELQALSQSYQALKQAIRGVKEA